MRCHLMTSFCGFLNANNKLMFIIKFYRYVSTFWLVRYEPWPSYNLFGWWTQLATIQNCFEPCLANIFFSINNTFVVSLHTKMWITTILTVSGFSFGPKLGAIFGVLCFCSDTDYFHFFFRNQFFLGILNQTAKFMEMVFTAFCQFMRELF